MQNSNSQHIVIPFYVRDVSRPILSVNRLTEQGFNITSSDQPTITNSNGFEAKLKQEDGLYFLSVTTTMPPAQKLDVHNTINGIKATLSPVTLTPEGAQWVTHNNDIWSYNSRGYLVRQHRRRVDNVEHSSHQIHNVQSQKTDWKTTEEQLPTRQTAKQKTSKNNTKTCSHNTGEDYSTQHGLEKRGSK